MPADVCVHNTTRPSGLTPTITYMSSLRDLHAQQVTHASKPLYRCWNMTADYFLLQLYSNGMNNQGTGANGLAIYQGSTKKIIEIKGLPSIDVISAFGKRPYNDANGMTYITVQTTDGNNPAVYEINPATGVATRGLEVECGQINYVGKLTTITE